MKIIDISRDAFNTEIYPGDPEPRYDWVERIGEDSDCNLSLLTLGAHTGTHVDAPLHFIEGGAAIDSCPPDAFVGPCTVIEVRPGVITGEDAENLLPKGCERLLIKSGGRAFFMDSSAELLADSGLKLIGTDSLSVGCKGNQLKPHRGFLQSGVSILEGLDLSEVSPGNYFLFAAPLKLGGLEAAPARALLIEDYIFWSGRKQ